MSPVAVFRLPLSTDLSGFVGLLRRLQVSHRVSEEAGDQVLWVADEQVAEQIRHLYQRFPDGNADIDVPAIEQPSQPGGVVAQLRANPVTAAVLLLCLVVAGLTGLGDNLQTIRWLTFLDFRVQGDYLYFTPLAESLAAGQWWRLLTPMLIHFGILHLAMNGLWYWELGRRIEWRQGPWMMLALSVIFGVVSNCAQYLFGGPSLFGGLSGVLYGLLGHVWLYQWLAPDPLYRLPRGVLVMMLVWLGLCMSGLITLLGFGAIANAAHVGGLLVGCLTGLLGGTLARRKLAA
ncbi:rhomboid family intramembrane serine protease [Pseudomonas sp. R5(2019)]|uniref:rhomboid family intramembrane serine protease n=1 Tax=Pseudomonas sp. R5(2019) TaxID=2697566 RepID=UPI0014125B38|nr:rhomboid family intramembrane serine protease [Pseudomonas sp. R5(2019)]NBA94293.1 rhomboid family intramembrane serine protease [Pseudomonas sp. R5(2019)]